MISTPSYELHHGDCLEVMPTLADNSVDMIITDLPFGETKAPWDIEIFFHPLFTQFNRLAKERTPIIFYASLKFAARIISFLETNFKEFDLTMRKNWVFDMSRPTNCLNVKWGPLTTDLHVLVFSRKGIRFTHNETTGHARKKATWDYSTSKGSELYGNQSGKGVYDSTTRKMRSVQPYKSGDLKKKLHPSEKSIEATRELIKAYWPIGHDEKPPVILDPTTGSASIGKAALEEGAYFIGIEKEQKYFDVACDGLEPTPLLKG